MTKQDIRKAEILVCCPSWSTHTVMDMGRVSEASLAQVSDNKSPHETECGLRKCFIATLPSLGLPYVYIFQVCLTV